jgi:uncharacterized phage protein (TIGR02220 family)
MKKDPGFNCFVPYALVTDETATSGAVRLYAIVSSLVLKEGYCYASNAYLASELNISDRAIRLIIAELVEKGWFEVRYYNNNVRHIYPLGVERFLKMIDQKKEQRSKKHKEGGSILPGGGSILPGGVEADFHINKLYYNNYYKHTVGLATDGECEVEICEHKQEVNKPSENKQKVNTPTAPKKDKYADQTISIIEELNTVTGRNFRNTDANMKYIRARLREGFTPNDFSAVIAFKTSQWASRADMKAYLRPETLFGAKFDAYLQEARQAQAARPVVEEGASGAYANYLKYAAKYSALGAAALLTQSEHHNLTEGEALSLYRRTFTKHELTALFHKAHEEAQEAQRRGQAVRVADMFKKLAKSPNQ